MVFHLAKLEFNKKELQECNKREKTPLELMAGKTLCAGEALAKTKKHCHRHYRGEPFLSVVIWPPTLIPSTNNMSFLKKLPSV